MNLVIHGSALHAAGPTLFEADTIHALEVTGAYIIAEPCIGTKDTACVDVCPVDCIHPAKGRTYDDGRPTFDEVPQLYIDRTECIDCGACVPVCPVTAIFVMDDLPEKWHAYRISRSTRITLTAVNFSATSIKEQEANIYLATAFGAYEYTPRSHS